MNGTQTGGIEVAPAGEEAPRQIGGYRQLFLDDSLVAYRMNVRREFNQVEKASFNPIIRCDKPWEREGDGYYIERMCTAFDKREGVHKMWYETVNTFENPPAEAPEHTTYTCYATSSDGVHWEKPDLGLVEYHGSTANNLIPFEGSDRHLTRLVKSTRKNRTHASATRVYTARALRSGSGYPSTPPTASTGRSTSTILPT